jgi:hypothetical protein
MTVVALALALHVMSRARLRELVTLFVIGSALTLAVFFFERWLWPLRPFTTFLFPPISLS